MLTWEEVKEEPHRALTMMPDEFCRQVADDIPQTIIPQLLDEVIDSHVKKGMTMDQAAYATASFMTGMHVGWFLSKRTL